VEVAGRSRADDKAAAFVGGEPRKQNKRGLQSGCLDWRNNNQITLFAHLSLLELRALKY
jgi:hypothetical protein